MALRTIDITYRRRDYRIRESLRDLGATVRPADDDRYCFFCTRTIRSGARCFRASSGRPYCIRCAIREGALVLVPHDPTRCQSTRAGVACDQCTAILDAADRAAGQAGGGGRR